MTREIDRYTRRTLREQLEDLWSWIVGHRAWVVGAAVVVVIGAYLASMTSPVRVEQLVAGDCLYIRTAAVDDPTSSRPIGDAAAVEQALMSGGAQRASCTASHGHEVSAIDRLAPPVPSGTTVTQESLRTLMEAECLAAFPGYVGHPLSGSIFATFAAAPTTDQLAGGNTTAVCLVARADGQWMSNPARGSGQ